MFDRKKLEEIERKKQEWLNFSKNWSERKPEFKTYSGIPIKRLYTPLDIAELNYLSDLSFPGFPPYTRGVYPTMYRGRLWTVRQLAGYGTPEDTNQRLKFLLEQGATGLNLVFDYPTLRGYDVDDPRVEADVGVGGVNINTVNDMEILFQDIPIDKITVSLVNCNPSAAISLFSMYLVAAEKRGISFKVLDGTNQNDFLMETAITFAPHIIPPKHSFRICCDIIEYSVKNVPKWHPISFVGYNIRESGTNAIQELAFVFANAIACTQELLDRGLKVDDFAEKFSFFFSAHNDFFEEIAKYRAARRIWYKIMKEWFKAEKPSSYMLKFHVQTAGCTLTAQQPLNNIVRAAYQALAAILGGAQSIHVDAYDEALCTPTETSALIALRTQHILQEETNVVNTVDPLGGSYYVEYLTNEMEKKVFDYLEKIKEQNGIVEAVEKGWIHREILKTASEYQKSVETGELKIVGVNCYRVEEEIPIEIFRPKPETVQIQRERLAKIKKERDKLKVQEALNKIREKCWTKENLMPYVLDAVRAYATLGEITNIFREEFGSWKPPYI
ncbi:methylmalonyl-CoA mutase [Candidatus Bathyarchaeota archaeon]|nr:MAG: methylmalonyl-CoA mutase [Candidatus Bathyarchaeota archaeon]